jgi:DoxX-like family
MTHTVAIWLLVAGFCGAGLVNAIGASGTRSDFARWGYPRWWGRFTGALELTIAVLIALPASRFGGLALGAAVIVAAIVTVLRHREFTHLVPLGVFLAALSLAVMSA